MVLGFNVVPKMLQNNVETYEFNITKKNPFYVWKDRRHGGWEFRAYSSWVKLKYKERWVLYSYLHYVKFYKFDFWTNISRFLHINDLLSIVRSSKHYIW